MLNSRRFRATVSVIALLGLHGVRCVGIFLIFVPLILSRLLIFRPLGQFFVANKLLSTGYGRRRYD